MTKLDISKRNQQKPAKMHSVFQKLGLAVNLSVGAAPIPNPDRPFVDTPILPSGGALGTGRMVRQCTSPVYPAPADPRAISQLSLHPDLNRKLVNKCFGAELAAWQDYYKHGALAVKQNPKNPTITRSNPPNARIAKLNMKIGRVTLSQESCTAKIQELRSIGAPLTHDKLERLQAKFVEQEHSARAFRAQVQELSFARKLLTLKKFERVQAEPRKPIVTLKEMKKTHFQ